MASTVDLKIVRDIRITELAWVTTGVILMVLGAVLMLVHHRWDAGAMLALAGGIIFGQGGLASFIGKAYAKLLQMEGDRESPAKQG